jgi:hypothetical protein
VQGAEGDRRAGSLPATDEGGWFLGVTRSPMGTASDRRKPSLGLGGPAIRVTVEGIADLADAGERAA